MFFSIFDSYSWDNSFCSIANVSHFKYLLATMLVHHAIPVLPTFWFWLWLKRDFVTMTPCGLQKRGPGGQ